MPEHPDVIHLVHALVKSDSLSMGRRLKQAQKALEKAEMRLEKNQRRSPAEWATQQVKAFQRASSAVESRNGYLSGMYHNQRGLSKERYPVWTVVYNFDCRASDGTTSAARFFDRSFPDLFETVLAGVGELPRPRRRTGEVGVSH